ncbi:TAT-variant-translocated molybdopterin oxidoreductase [Anaeromyxobacter paludicola]|uniref:Molybdopterin oxidoreductase n=1 Tax=Anaeromyxobacter paludicola TaxID=2918171 RepID=A0ABN6NBA4_9BACT|nr:TAT-variant-translocated molybdopterin oxidoreductase [Anaeromyxobacter paludicola]BDG10517.1 molybdopterin oxidoreductase [Anaeromyxobacter paludicola]
MGLPIYGQAAEPPTKPNHRPLWRSLEELAQGRSEARSPEFAPGADGPPDALSRRSFMQLLGATLAFAGLEACSPPREKIYPFVRQPVGLVPGQAVHYATAATLSGYATGLLVRSNEGRPTKVEGNPNHPASLGGVGPFQQAMLLDLYDPSRARGFQKKGRQLSYRAALLELSTLARSHEKDGGARLRFLADPSSSPLLADLRRRILARFPKARFTAWDPLSDDAARDGGRIAFGAPLEARPALGPADVILSLDADFLGLGPDQLRLMREWSSRRVPGQLNRLYQVEPGLSVTGMNADHHLRTRAAEVAGFARAVAARLAAKHGLAALAPLGEGAAPNPRADVVADDLARARGRSLVLCGPRQPAAVHALAHALNAALGNAGATVRYRKPVLNDAATGPAGLAALAAELRAGQVDTLVVTAANPVYTAPADLGLAPLLEQVPNAIYFTLHDDETADACGWMLAASHPYEQWGDARGPDGTVALAQPLIAPLFESMGEVELLAAFLDQADLGPRRLLQDLWRERRGGAAFDAEFERWLAAGVVPGTAEPAEAPAVQSAAVAQALRDLKPAGAGGLEVSFVPDYKTLDGRFAPNAWLQELPHPVSKMTWDNAAYLSPATAGRLGLVNGDLVELQLAGRSLTAPVWVQPGHADDALTLPLGYGRRAGGPVSRNVGFDAGRLRRGDAPWFAAGAALRKLGKRHAFAVTQTHDSMEGRPLALDFTAAGWEHEKGELEEHRGEPASLMPQMHAYEQEQYRWGMAVDLSRCTGCSACVVACQSENNIPVVGKEQVERRREMQWLRIDRYYQGTAAEPEVALQPVACVHCEKAPCEYVCPVNATVHSDEGLNEMVYNRCVGTRYCSNNCPYKVRRFNFLDYRGEMAPTEKMLMNPEVTVRTRGVMEKCTYCVQRIERARIEARVAGRLIREQDLKSACQQACPAEAIVFGNLNDPQARVTRLHQDERRYDLLHELGTRPRTTYLARLRNPNPDLA